MGYETARRLKNDQNDLRKSPSHWRKIDEKNKTKAKTPHIPLPYAVTREIITAVICAQNQ